MIIGFLVSGAVFSLADICHLATLVMALEHSHLQEAEWGGQGGAESDGYVSSDGEWLSVSQMMNGDGGRSVTASEVSDGEEESSGGGGEGSSAVTALVGGEGGGEDAGLSFDSAEVISRPRVRQMLRPRHAQMWDEDSAVLNCTACKVEFTSVPMKEPARHHCRSCGRIFCHRCSSHKIELPREFEQFPVRSKSQQPSLVASVFHSFKGYVVKVDANKERVCDQCHFQWSDLQDRNVRLMIGAFEILGFDLFELRNVAVVCKTWYKAANFWIAALRQLQYRLPSHQFDARERRMLINNAPHLVGHSSWMVQLLRVIDWADPAETARALRLVQAKRSRSCRALLCTRHCCRLFQPMDVLHLLRIVEHPTIRAELVKCLRAAPVDILKALVPSLVSLIEYDPVGNSPTADFVLELAQMSLTVASDAFWALKVAVEEASSAIDARRYACVMHRLLLSLGAASPECARWGDAILSSEVLDMACAQLGSGENLRAGGDVKDAVLATFASVGLFQGEEGAVVVSPVLPRKVVSGLDAEHVYQFAASKNGPIRLAFLAAEDGAGASATASGKEEEEDTGERFDVLYKVGDDLRVDQAMVNIIKVMTVILEEAGMTGLPVVQYRVTATGAKRGYIEMVPRAKTLTEITKLSDASTVGKYLQNCNRHRPPSEYLEDFALSTAIYTVMVYLLGVGDRHGDNVMLTEDGKLFHIDYGFIMGSEPFKLVPSSSWLNLTPQLRDAMQETERELFKDTCSRVYNSLRRYAPLFMTMLSLGTGLDLTEYSEEIMLRFLPGVGDAEAAALFLARLQISGGGTWTELINDFYRGAIHEDEPNYFQQFVRSLARLPSSFPAIWS